MQGTLRRQARTAALWTLAGCALVALAAALLIPIFFNAESLAKSNKLPEALPAASLTPSYVLRDVWMRFDTVRYLLIAKRGYDEPVAVVFYPLYPLLIRELSTLGLDPLTAALLIARVATFFLFWALLAMYETERTLPLILAWPSSFIFFAGYPDSLLTALCAWSLYFAWRKRWWIASLLTVLACVTKAAGAAMVVALLVLAWRSDRKKLWVAATAAAGPLLYPAWLKSMGLMQPSEAYPRFWKTVPAMPWETLWLAVSRSTWEFDFRVAVNFACFLLFAWAAWRGGLREEEKAYAGAGMLLFLVKKTEPLLQSTLRYLLMIFPVFPALAARMRKRESFLLACLLLGIFNLALLYAFWNWLLVV